MTNQSLRKRLALAVISSFLLTLAFPRWNLWGLAWISFVPLFHALDHSRNRRDAFLIGFASGFVFFLLSIGWLRHVTVFGMFFVVTMQAVYWGVFSIVYFSIVGAGPRACPGSGQPQGVAPTILLAASWTALEFIRTEIPVWGFGWNLLGTSQAPNLWLVQLASIGGVYAVSFVVFLGNAVIYSSLGSRGTARRAPTVGAAPRGRPDGGALGQPCLPAGRAQGVAPTFGNSLLFLFLLLAVLLFGWSRFQAFAPSSFLRVSVLQGNIPQLIKWDAGFKRQILRIYLNLTRLASYDAPQLIVWPEAAFPGFFNQDPLARRVHHLIRDIRIPLVAGSPHAEGEGRYYNSAYLLTPSPSLLPKGERGKREEVVGPISLSPNGGEGGGEGEVSVIQRYDKIRLVPFGEYVPWKPVFGFLERYAYALGVSDFSPGKTFTVFELPESAPFPFSPNLAGAGQIKFSTLICFEDIFPDLARKFVNQGADFLFVLTNDAWFGRSSAPYQHLQASQLRAVENGVSVVRAANTGVSAFITPLGEVVERVHNQEGKDTFVMGGVTYPVVLSQEETIYRKGGWLFPYVCLAVLILLSLRGVVLGNVGAGFPRPGCGRGNRAPTPPLRIPAVTGIFLVAFILTGCIRLQGGTFYAKKEKEGEPAKIKEIHVDTDELLGRGTSPKARIEAA